MSLPTLTVIAGPNGSGKSTLIAQLRDAGVQFGEYINADDLARLHGLTSDEGARKAQARADQLREECLARGADFSFETVMSHPSKVALMNLAARRGYQVAHFFVATSDPIVNVLRVRDRVYHGGHEVPEDRIIARYWRTLSLLPSAVLAAHRSVIFDNSSPVSHGGGRQKSHAMRRAAIAVRKNDTDALQFTLRLPIPSWLLESLRFAKLGYALDPPRIADPDSIEMALRPAPEIGTDETAVAAGDELSLAAIRDASMSKHR